MPNAVEVISEYLFFVFKFKSRINKIWNYDSKDSFPWVILIGSEMIYAFRA